VDDQTLESRPRRAALAWRLVWTAALATAATLGVVWCVGKFATPLIEDGLGVAPTLWMVAGGGVMLAGCGLWRHGSSFGRKAKMAAVFVGYSVGVGFGLGGLVSWGLVSWGLGARLALILILPLVGFLFFIPFGLAVAWLCGAWVTTWKAWKACRTQGEGSLLLNEQAAKAVAKTWNLLLLSIEWFAEMIEWFAEMKSPRVVWERLHWIPFSLIVLAGWWLVITGVDWLEAALTESAPARHFWEQARGVWGWGISGKALCIAAPICCWWVTLKVFAIVSSVSGRALGALKAWGLRRRR